ncbi:hypothetical protein QBC37DRAFT_392108 [Rhypophila decipiens]|uniref:Uncharacterized protein n=1 Tax=Rhypophila decipiens TaxID=261697 RepID=A0AAN7B390_9PEZI|nr:hypothetical protein QBC37DRAFT_392108 [Rhypophila decipiens]
MHRQHEVVERRFPIRRTWSWDHGERRVLSWERKRSRYVKRRSTSASVRDVVRNMLNAEVQENTKHDETPLHLACRAGHLPIMSLLLAYGADRRREVLNNGETALAPVQAVNSWIAGRPGAGKSALMRPHAKDPIHGQSFLSWVPSWKGYSCDSTRNNRSRHDGRQSRTRRIATNIFDGAIIMVGGVPTLAILKFNENLGKCPLPEGLFTWKTILQVYKDYIDKEAEVLDVLSHGWHLLLRYWNQYLPDILVCPRWPVYLLAMSTYSAVGIYHLVHRQPRYWAESGLLVMMVSIILGSWYGVPAMFNSLVLGAFLSLLCCKILD